MRYVTGWREVVTTARLHTGRRSGGDAASGRELSAHNERVCVCALVLVLVSGGGVT